MGTLAAIFIASDAAAPMQQLDTVRAVPGRGLEGDRYFLGTGAFSRWPGPRREVTLIEMEALEVIETETGLRLFNGEHRRNLVVRGVHLRTLVHQLFAIGEVQLRGVQPCLPCGYLETISAPGIRNALRYRGGLRAAILSEGVLRIGDRLTGGSVNGRKDLPSI